MRKLDPEIVLQTLQGYAEVNRITNIEQRNRLLNRTNRESLVIFLNLYKTWEKLKTKQDYSEPTLRRDDEFIYLRKLLDKIAEGDKT